MFSVVFSPDGQYLLTGNYDSIADLWAVRSQPFTLQLAHGGPVRDVRFSTDGKLVLTAAAIGDMMAHIWKATTGVELHTLKGHTAQIYGAAFSPDGKMVATAANNPGLSDQSVRLWDTQTGGQRKVITPAFGISAIGHAIDISPDAKWLLIGSHDDAAHLLDVETGKEVLPRFEGHTDDVVGVAFSPDGELVVTASIDKLVKVWDFETRKEVKSLEGHTASVNSAVFSPDGTMVLTASDDGTARLWDVQTEQEVRRFTGHVGQVSQAVFSSDGKWIVTGGDDNTARLWDVQSGQELRRFVGHTDEVLAVAISPDGKYVATASSDNKARVWHTDYHEAVRYLCARLSRDFTDQERAQYGIQDNEPTCPEK
jgi:WD40 repeat protein